MNAWWRQNSKLVQVVVEMPEDASFKRDVSVDISRKKIALSVSGTDVLVGELANDVVTEESEWFVEDELDGFDGDRFLVVAMRKQEWYVDWAAPLRGETTPVRKLRIGGEGEAQKDATAQQLQSYQILQKLPSAVRADVYARVPTAAGEVPSEMLYFVGKVIAESARPAASVAAQEMLVKEHARLYQPDLFGGFGDDAIDLWLAPGNTEMRVAQNELPLQRWTQPSDDAVLPAAGSCGFEPETLPPAHMGGDPFKVRRDAQGQPLSAAFQANVVKPDEVPGAYEAYLTDLPVKEKLE